MAITKIDPNRPANQPGMVSSFGASTVSGGVENSKVLNEGVATRGPEGEKKLVEDAEKFMKSKLEFAKKEEQAAKEIAAGKTTTSVSKAVEDAQEKASKEAEKKPAVPGGNPDAINSPAALKSAEQVKKVEEKAVVNKEGK